MIVKPIHLELELGGDDAKNLYDSLKETTDSPGYDYIKKLVNSLVNEAFIKLMHNDTFGELMYDRGFIGGLEALMQNVELELEKLKEIVDAVSKVEDKMEGEDEKIS